MATLGIVKDSDTALMAENHRKFKELSELWCVLGTCEDERKEFVLR